MLSLILVVAIISWTIYRIKKGKKVISKEFFEDQFSRKPPYDNPPWLLAVLIYGVIFIIAIYAAMIIYILDYDANVEAIAYYRNNITQIEVQITELDTSIEETELNFEISKEEKDAILKVLTREKEVLEIELKANNKELNKIPLNQSPERLSFYKFLLYFGH